MYEGKRKGIGQMETTKNALPSSLTERLPTEDEIESAADAAIVIAIAMERDNGLTIPGPDGNSVKIAPSIAHLVIDLLGHVSAGNMVTLVPTGTMLTTQEAADILNVSRPHLTGLLKAGKIRYEEVGRHRRVRLNDLMQYRDQRARAQEDALQRLSDLGQDFEAG